MSKKRQTNVHFVRELMERSETGAMAQIFIIDAIAKQADRVAETPLDKLKEAFGENSFISAEGWHKSATEISNKMKERSQ